MGVGEWGAAGGWVGINPTPANSLLPLTVIFNRGSVYHILISLGTGPGFSTCGDVSRISLL